MAKFKKKKFRAEKPNSEDENNDFPEIEATEDEKKKLLNGQQELLKQQNHLVRTLNVKNVGKLLNMRLMVLGFAKNVDLNIKKLLMNLLKKLRQNQNLNLQRIL